MDNITRQEKIQQFGVAYDILVRALQAFPRKMWDYKPSPDEWSIQEIIVHIADSETNAYVRCRRAIAEPGSAVLGYDPLQWSRALDYPNQNADEALQLFRYLRLMTYHLLRSLPESTFAHTIDHSENGIMTLDDWLNTYSAHAYDHLEQIKGVYAVWQAQQ